MKRYNIELWKFASEPGGSCPQVAQICVDVPDDVNIYDFSESVLKLFSFADYADVYHKGEFCFRV